MTTVLVDAMACKPGQSGILSHGVGLVSGLVRRSELDVLTIASSLDEFAAIGGIRLRAAPRATRSFVPRTAWRQTNLGRLVRAEAPDVLLSTVPELPVGRIGIPTVMVVHDVAAVVAPALYPLAKRLRYEVLLRRALADADHVVCVSYATLLDLHRWSGIDPARCSVIGNAPQELEAPVEELAELKGHLLLVGNIYENKNTRTILGAVEQLKQMALEEGSPPPRLIMVGPLDRLVGVRLRKDLRERQIEDVVEHRGFVSTIDLGRLYRGARAVLYPSLYEGQGIPVMEAMSYGVPVVASDLPSVREFVSGSAVHLVSHILDPHAWARAIREVSGGVDRTPMNHGRSWSAVAAEFSGLLERIAQKGNSTHRSSV